MCQDWGCIFWLGVNIGVWGSVACLVVWLWICFLTWLYEVK